MKKDFWKRDGVITLVATLLGVFLGLYVNEWNASRNLKKQKKIATENIMMEIRSNKEKLKESVENYSKMLQTFYFFRNTLTSKGEVISTVEYMTEFKAKNPGILKTLDSVKVEGGKYNYTKMNMNLNYTVEEVELRTIAWETLKNSDVISTFSFDYLMKLEYIYNFIKDISQTNNIIFNDGKKFAQSDLGVLDNLIFNTELAIDSEKKLIEECNNLENKNGE